jgi:hypothetical protein
MKITTARRIGILIVGLVIASASLASAQDVFKVNYFENNFRGTRFAQLGKVRIANPGLTYGNLCAMIYVFKSDQEMEECCGCMVSHDGLLTLGIESDLASNQLIVTTKPTNQSGLLKIVSSRVNGAGSTCDPTSRVSPRANLRVWVTHIQTVDQITSSIGIPLLTETESSDSPLGPAELAAQQAQCSFIHILGSGRGICTCGTGD